MFVIAIPTYWSRPAGEKGHPEDSIFDHPTALDRRGTLGRCLESMRLLRGPPFTVLIITAVVNDALSEAVERQVEEIIAPFRKSYPILQLAPSDLTLLKTRSEALGLDADLLSLGDYAHIRNCQLLGALLLGAELVAAIDDDEIVPANYLVRAGAHVGQKQGQDRIDGVAGIYLNSAGEYRLKEDPDIRNSANVFVKKAALMNDEIGSYMDRAQGLAETAIALGGNMVFSRELVQNVAFDPGITRGEDIDYLLNSRLLGYHWYVDTELQITHLPPPARPDDPVNTSPFAKLQQDVIRFFYQREKIKLSQDDPRVHNLSAKEFGLYPGAFFRDDLETHTLEILKSSRPPNADESFFPLPEALIAEAKERAAKAGDFVRFNERWKHLLQILEEDRTLVEHFRQKSSF